ncbi:MAG: RNA-binding protein [Bacteroidales bacterium]|nr:RNA-binding protein [Bacteroidales bacterium]
MNIFVANLNFKIQDNFLRELFENYGEVNSAKVIMDRMTGRSKGFGFVEMANDQDAQNAINELNGKEVQGKALVVKQAYDRDNDQRSNRR